MSIIHCPVLLAESCSYLINKSGGIYFDATLGFGGHAENFLKLLSNDSLLIAVDVDKEALNYCKEKFKHETRIKFYNFNFSKIDIISKLESVKGYDGIFADLGVSSYQLDEPNAGFTFRKEAKLDLRMDKSKPLSAEEVINTFSLEELSTIFFSYGEEKNSRKISKTIVEHRLNKKIKTTKDLVELIAKITPPNYLNKTLARIFQAVRIYVNDELEMLKSFLSKSVELLLPGARLAVISYHSLEDRIVKDFFKYENLSCVCPKDFPVCQCEKQSRLKIITKKPIVPQQQEIILNNRSRSAKLRIAEKI